jgi:hypothetical protein
MCMIAMKNRMMLDFDEDEKMEGYKFMTYSSLL